MKKQRKFYTATEKVAILRRHFIEKVPVSAICDEYRIKPSVFYHWQKVFFENGANAFCGKADNGGRKYQEKITRLEEKLKKKDEVLGELMEEHVALKKSLGES
ncbi:MAG: transposase [bacterium]